MGRFWKIFGVVIEGDGKSTVPSWAEWVNHLNTWRVAGYIHDALRERGINRLLSFISFILVSVLVIIITVLVAPLMWIGLLIWEIAEIVAPAYARELRSSIISKK